MATLRSSVAAIAMIACGGARAPAAPPATSRPPVDAAAPDAAAPDAAPPAPLATACRAMSIDLSHVARACRTEDKPVTRPLPAAIAFAVDPPTIVMHSGDQRRARETLTNTSEHDVELVFDRRCHYAGNLGYAIYGRYGQQVDIDHSGTKHVCATGSCLEDHFAIVLPPGGVAWVPFLLDARQSGHDDRCPDTRAGGPRVTPGHYELRVHSDFGDARAPLTIDGLPALPAE